MPRNRNSAGRAILEGWEALEYVKQLKDGLVGICEEAKKTVMPPSLNHSARKCKQLKTQEIVSVGTESQSFRKNPVEFDSRP